MSPRPPRPGRVTRRYPAPSLPSVVLAVAWWWLATSLLLLLPLATTTTTTTTTQLRQLGAVAAFRPVPASVQRRTPLSRSSGNVFAPLQDQQQRQQRNRRGDRPSTRLYGQQVTQQEAQRGIDRVVQALRKDSTAKRELGTLARVTNVLGYGTPQPGLLAVRFNAAFQRAGFGRSAVPLPFGLGQSDTSEGRGTMVGQVKASVDQKTGKVVSCSVFRDLGYGRSFELKC
jgi:hypothetical protein